MPKTIPVPLLANYASDTPTTAFGLRITRTDAEVYGWTSADIDTDDIGDSVLYRAAPGLDVASWAASAGLAVGNTELRILHEDDTITRADILAGRWNNAEFALFRYNWASPSDGVEPISAGRLGEVTPRAGHYVVELRDLRQYLQQPVGAASTKTCRARLGDAMCMVDLGPWTETGAITGVTSKQVFTDTARTEADDYFGEGILTWTGGLNTGLSQKVKTYASDTFTLSLPMIFNVQVGDTYSVIAGCRKRLDEDCATKFGNELNFQGEPHRPTVDELTSAPAVNV